MMTMKTIYEEKVGQPLQHLRVFETTGTSQLMTQEAIGVEPEPLDEGDYLRLIKNGGKTLEVISGRMAQSMGITADQFIKSEGQIGKDALLSFFDVGIHWALKESPHNALFLDSLGKSYIRFLKPDQLKEIRSTLRNMIDETTSNGSNLYDLLERYETYTSAKNEADEKGVPFSSEELDVDMDASERLRASALLGFLQSIGHKVKGTSASASGSRRKTVVSTSHAEMEELLDQHGERVVSVTNKKTEKNKQKRQKREQTQSQRSFVEESSESDSEEEEEVQVQVQKKEKVVAPMRTSRFPSRDTKTSKQDISLALEEISSSASVSGSSVSRSRSRSDSSDAMNVPAAAESESEAEADVEMEMESGMGMLPSSRRRFRN
jgi:hypothetical protein